MNIKTDMNKPTDRKTDKGRQTEKNRQTDGWMDRQAHRGKKVGRQTNR